MISYLSDRRHFVQIDDKSLNFARVTFDLPHRFVWGPVIFSLCVADFQDGVKCKSFQYADERSYLVW